MSLLTGWCDLFMLAPSGSGVVVVMSVGVGFLCASQCGIDHTV